MHKVGLVSRGVKGYCGRLLRIVWWSPDRLDSSTLVTGLASIVGNVKIGELGELESVGSLGELGKVGKMVTIESVGSLGELGRLGSLGTLGYMGMLDCFFILSFADCLFVALSFVYENTPLAYWPTGLSFLGREEGE